MIKKFKPTMRAGNGNWAVFIKEHLEENKAKIIVAYEDGGTSKTIGKKYGTTSSTLIKYLRSWGVPIRRKGPACYKHWAKYHKWLGIWPDAKIAKDLGVTRQAVALARRSKGIPSLRAQKQGAEKPE